MRPIDSYSSGIRKQNSRYKKITHVALWRANNTTQIIVATPTMDLDVALTQTKPAETSLSRIMCWHVYSSKLILDNLEVIS